jgi:hypothetical protein
MPMRRQWNSTLDPSWAHLHITDSRLVAHVSLHSNDSLTSIMYISKIPVAPSSGLGSDLWPYEIHAAAARLQLFLQFPQLTTNTNVPPQIFVYKGKTFYSLAIELIYVLHHSTQVRSMDIIRVGGKFRLMKQLGSGTFGSKFSILPRSLLTYIRCCLSWSQCYFSTGSCHQARAIQFRATPAGARIPSVQMSC